VTSSRVVYGKPGWASLPGSDDWVGSASAAYKGPMNGDTPGNKGPMNGYLKAAERSAARVRISRKALLLMSRFLSTG
jgi:hypothetical protein